MRQYSVQELKKLRSSAGEQAVPEELKTRAEIYVEGGNSPAADTAAPAASSGFKPSGMTFASQHGVKAMPAKPVQEKKEAHGQGHQSHRNEKRGKDRSERKRNNQDRDRDRDKQRDAGERDRERHQAKQAEKKNEVPQEYIAAKFSEETKWKADAPAPVDEIDGEFAKPGAPQWKVPQPQPQSQQPGRSLFLNLMGAGGGAAGGKSNGAGSAPMLSGGTEADILKAMAGPPAVQQQPMQAAAQKPAGLQFTAGQPIDAAALEQQIMQQAAPIQQQRPPMGAPGGRAIPIVAPTGQMPGLTPQQPPPPQQQQQQQQQQQPQVGMLHQAPPGAPPRRAAPIDAEDLEKQLLGGGL